MSDRPPEITRALDSATVQPSGAEATESFAGPAPPSLLGSEALLVYFPSEAKPSTDIPKLLGKFTIRGRLGAGGMGIVYRAFDPQAQREVALKTLRSGLFANEEEVQRFYLEARAIAKFQHPNLVRLLEIDQDQGQHYFAMEFLPGGNLAERKEEFKKQGPQVVAQLLEKIARAVHFVHDHGVLHRDLKPANILLNADGEPQVADFGLAKFLDGPEDITQTGEVLGTLFYMSPEQVAGIRDLTGVAVDVWSLGVILFELLTGQRPFVGKTKADTTQAIRTAPPPSVRRLNPGLDRDLETIINHCLEKDPAHRYASALALADDLQAWRAGLPIQARPWPWPVRSWRKAKRRPLTATVLGLLGVGAAVWLTMLVTHDPDRWEKNIQRDLQANHEVELIGMNGGPAGLRWHLGAAQGRVINLRDQPFQIQGDEFALVELVKDPGRSSYRFQAEILHLKAPRASGVGLFVAHRALPLPTGPAHFFLKTEFGDVDDFRTFWKPIAELAQAPVPPGNILFNQAMMVALPGLDLYPALWREEKNFYFERPPHVPAAWRQVALEVTTKEVRLFWEGKPARVWTWESINTQAIKSLAALRAEPTWAKDLADLPPFGHGFGPRQGLGLLVYEGAAQFRKVKLQPIADEP